MFKKLVLAWVSALISVNLFGFELNTLIKKSLNSAYQLKCVDLASDHITCYGPKTYGDSVFFTIEKNKNIKFYTTGSLKKVFLGETQDLFGSKLIQTIQNFLLQDEILEGQCKKAKSKFRLTALGFEKGKVIKCSNELKKVKIYYSTDDQLDIKNGKMYSQGKVIKEMIIKQ